MIYAKIPAFADAIAMVISWTLTLKDDAMLNFKNTTQPRVLDCFYCQAIVQNVSQHVDVSKLYCPIRRARRVPVWFWLLSRNEIETQGLLLKRWNEHLFVQVALLLRQGVIRASLFEIVTFRKETRVDYLRIARGKCSSFFFPFLLLPILLDSNHFLHWHGAKTARCVRFNDALDV